MPSAKVIPGDETILLVPVTEINGVVQCIGDSGLVPFTAPTTALLNSWVGLTSPGVAGSSAGGNISQAVVNDLKLEQSDSQTDSTAAVTDTGDSLTPTFYQFSAQLNSFADLNPADASSIYNLAHNLMRAPDAPYAIVHRVGKTYTEEFAVGDDVTLYYAWTDVPIWGIGDGNMITQDQTFVPKSLINAAYVLAE